MDIPGLSAFLLAQMVGDRTKESSLRDNLETKVESDSLSKLPSEVLHELLTYLSGQEALALRTASLVVLRATSNNHFWKQMILRDMPWFWELDGLAHDARSRDLNLDYKRLYFWLEKETRTLFGNDSPFLGLVNRARIWRVCGEAAHLYFQEVEAGQQASTV
jgi:hypothetical protein